MDWKALSKKLYDRILAVAFDNSDTLKKLWTGTLQKREGGIPFVTPPKLSEAKVALITTGGFHRKDAPAFNMSDPKGDPSYREIDTSLAPDQFAITHDYYDHKDAAEVRNVVFPIDRMKELAQEKVIGELAQTCYSFMGHVADDTHIPKMEENAREVAAKLKAARVTVALLAPA
jgi:D-proline reductase (dithiol) PrdB